MNCKKWLLTTNIVEYSLLGVCWLQHIWLFRRRSRLALLHGRTQAASQARQYHQLPPHKTLQEINSTKEELSDSNAKWRRDNYELDVAARRYISKVCGGELSLVTFWSSFRAGGTKIRSVETESGDTTIKGR